MRRKKQGNQKRSTNVKAKLRANISFRMNVLFFSIFLLFSVLILRLGYMQIVKGEHYAKQLEKTEEVTVNTSVPRGRIYDRNGKILVENKAKNAITYTKYSSTSSDEMIEVATKLANLIKMDTSKLTERDQKDFWIRLNSDEAAALITEEDTATIKKQTTDVDEQQVLTDNLQRERITEKMLKSLSKTDLEVLAIYSKMVAGYNSSPQIIKSDDVSDKEFAIVSENLTDLPGINTTTDWARKKASDLSILGSTTTPAEGIPKDQLDYYLARDYSRNDRVGKSYIEQQYEELLQGTKAVVKTETSATGEIETKTVTEGEAGKDLVLTIDSELQTKVEKIVSKKLVEAKAAGGASLLDRAFIVMMDPKTGEVLSMVGKKLVTGENGQTKVEDYAIGTFTTSYEVGSVVKPATLLTSYGYGAIKEGEVIVDAPMRLGGITKRSLFNKTGSVAINDVTALERSSNVYMFKSALKVAGINYGTDNINSVTAEDFTKMRRGYEQFGLGIETGIDLPGEFTGVRGPEALPGKYLDLAIGQYDTFTPLQLAQYVSTVANGGNRVKPHLLKEIHEPSKDGKMLGALEEEVEPVVLNKINNTQSQIDRVHQGMYKVYYGNNGSANAYFNDTKYKAAGKTGTAEVVYYGPKKERYGTKALTLTHVGYAPYEDPQVAYAVVVPWVTTTTTGTGVNNKIARESLDTYFKLQKKKNKENEQTVSTKIDSD